MSRFRVHPLAVGVVILALIVSFLCGYAYAEPTVGEGEGCVVSGRGFVQCAHLGFESQATADSSSPAPLLTGAESQMAGNVRVFQEAAWWGEVARQIAEAREALEAGQVPDGGGSSKAQSSQGTATPAPSGSSGTGDAAFLACVRAHESDTAGGYQASNGTHFGAYQFAPSTWDSAAQRSGRSDLVGIDPRNASPADQDAMASYLYETDGAGHWAGSGCY